MINKQAFDFIDQSLLQGATKEKITNDLLEQGLVVTEIDECFNTLEKEKEENNYSLDQFNKNKFFYLISGILMFLPLYLIYNNIPHLLINFLVYIFCGYFILKFINKLVSPVIKSFNPITSRIIILFISSVIAFVFSVILTYILTIVFWFVVMVISCNIHSCGF